MSDALIDTAKRAAMPIVSYDECRRVAAYLVKQLIEGGVSALAPSAATDAPATPDDQPSRAKGMKS